MTLAFVDSGFFPHPDLTRPVDRIRAYHDATGEGAPLYAEVQPWMWHGTMTACVAAGSGYLSAEVFRGIASEAGLVLVKASSGGRVTPRAVERGLRWVLENRERFGIRVVNVSLGVRDPRRRIAAAVDALVAAGVVVVAASGNSLRLPESPGRVASALTVGGYEETGPSVDLYASSYGRLEGGVLKPEVLAPAVRVAFPILPGTTSHREAAMLMDLAEAEDGRLPELFHRYAARLDLPEEVARLSPGELRALADGLLEASNVVDRHYRHAEGTSVAAPIVASVVAQMLEVRPELTPAQVRTLLVASAVRVAGAPVERQGFGRIHARRAVALAAEEALPVPEVFAPPRIEGGHLAFYLFEPGARSVALVGDFNGWDPGSTPGDEVSPGLWRASLPLPRTGVHRYKFVVDGTRWVEDPANMRREPDGHGGTHAVVEVGGAP